MEATRLAPLVTAIVDQLPALLERTRETEAEADSLKAICRALESEIQRVQRVLAHERAVQKARASVGTRGRTSDVGGKGRKRQRNDDDEIERIVKPRLSGSKAVPRKRKRDSGASSMSVRTKRRGRVFTEDEAVEIIGTVEQVDGEEK
ncbi:hypothetical protein PLICRDRAFT_46374 [Plicaturopsis crispa FD-325 SS-3]|uniref:Uncharacterized protein n=1 Tax=Plicaturopsis crispa FD-325 SS-3 TaxID=944288 RepID=A0A0C9T3X4_PLICR|nr:hypothetical protein PLICRDRAFT_46374 [Plicaturopsis crispa FD-325 SS-3]